MHGKTKAGEWIGKSRIGAYRHSPRSIAVVGMFQSNDAAFFSPALVLPILRSQLERNLHRSRAIVGIKNVLERRRNNVLQFSGELLNGGMRESGEQDMVEG